MYSLKSIQKIEFYDPYNTVIEGANYTFFKKKLPLYRASRLCNKMGFSPLSLANLLQNTALPGPLLLQFELSYSGRLFCVGPDKGFVDDAATTLKSMSTGIMCSYFSAQEEAATTV
jgi:hypothetical protein